MEVGIHRNGTHIKPFLGKDMSIVADSPVPELN